MSELTTNTARERLLALADRGTSMLASAAVSRTGTPGPWAETLRDLASPNDLPAEIVDELGSIGAVLGRAYDVVGLIERRSGDAALEVRAYACDGRHLCRIDGADGLTLVGPPIDVVAFVDQVLDSIGDLADDEKPTTVHAPQPVLAALRTVLSAHGEPLPRDDALKRLAHLTDSAAPEAVVEALERDGLVALVDEVLTTGPVVAETGGLQAVLSGDELRVHRISCEPDDPQLRAGFAGPAGERHALLRDPDDPSVIRIARMRRADVGVLLLDMLVSWKGPARLPTLRSITGDAGPDRIPLHDLTSVELVDPASARHRVAAETLAWPAVVVSVVTDDATLRSHAGIAVAEGRAFKWTWAGLSGSAEELDLDAIAEVVAADVLPDNPSDRPARDSFLIEPDDLDQVFEDATGTDLLRTRRSEVTITWRDGEGMVVEQGIILDRGGGQTVLIEQTTTDASDPRWTVGPASRDALASWLCERLPATITP